MTNAQNVKLHIVSLKIKNRTIIIYRMILLTQLANEMNELQSWMWYVDLVKLIYTLTMSY